MILAEATMYKTILLELLHQNPTLWEQLRTTRKLMPTLNAYAAELKTKHQAWMETLRPTRPGSDPSQLSSEAMELAIEDVKGSLLAGSPTNEDEPLTLDAAMAYLRRHTPPA
jgi:hypothetical protein